MTKVINCIIVKGQLRFEGPKKVFSQQEAVGNSYNCNTKYKQRFSFDRAIIRVKVFSAYYTINISRIAFNKPVEFHLKKY
jgi:hypothetical protein